MTFTSSHPPSPSAGSKRPASSVSTTVGGSKENKKRSNTASKEDGFFPVFKRAKSSASTTTEAVVDLSEDVASPTKNSKKAKGDISASILPLTPRPLSAPNDHSWYSPSRSEEFVVYLVFEEPAGSKFCQGIQRCKELCTDREVLDKCFQRDGTRHVTLANGISDPSVAQRLVLDERFQQEMKSLPVHVQFGTGFNKWKGGLYLGVTPESVRRLETIVNQLKVRLSSEESGHNTSNNKNHSFKFDGTHLSLFRSRNCDSKRFYSQIAKIRKAMNDFDWGRSLPGVSIRIKQVGTDYNQCRVLWSSSSS